MRGITRVLIVVAATVLPAVVVWNGIGWANPLHHDLSDIATGLMQLFFSAFAALAGLVITLVAPRRREGPHESQSAAVIRPASVAQALVSAAYPISRHAAMIRFDVAGYSPRARRVFPSGKTRSGPRVRAPARLRTRSRAADSVHCPCTDLSTHLWHTGVSSTISSTMSPVIWDL